MSLVTKIFAAFIVITAIAIAAGVMGWNAVQGIDETMSRITEYEIAAETNLADIGQAAQALTVAQRTLINTDIVGSDREDQHNTLMSRKNAILAAVAGLNGVFDAGAARVSGWGAIRNEWLALRPGLEKWMAGVDENDALIRSYEATTILAPDALLWNIEAYRGDHFQLVALVGEMLAKEESIGPPLTPLDNLCAFGQWRARIESGEEPYSGNAAIADALKGMTEPHRKFHASAAELQKLIGEGYEKNPDLIDGLFVELVDAARSVTGQFQIIGDEAQRARAILGRASAFTMETMRVMRQESIAALDALASSNTANMNKNVALATADGERGVRTMQTLALAALVVGVLVIAMLFFAIRNGLSRPLTRVITALSGNAGDVSREAHEVEDSSRSLSDGASSQSAALQETSAAVEEITSMARKNLDNSKAANTEMQTASKQIQDSASDMEQMSSAMGEIKESSEKISNILKTIEEIAFQTNLLALNAAVEAARAGEAGKGFAVVADEVRNLAGRSAQAVKDTSELITGTVARINNGDAITRRIKEHFGGITVSAERVTKMIAEIESATSEQTLGMEQINQSVAQIDQINQKAAEGAEANAAASGSLNGLSGNLMEQIGDLGQVMKTIIGGKGVTEQSGNPGKPRRPSKKKPQLALPAPGE